MKENDNQELIEKIFKEVKDPQLRDQLLKIVLERNHEKRLNVEIFEDIGINPYGVRQNIVLSKGLIIAVGIILFLCGLYGLANNSGQIEGTKSFFILWLVSIPIIMIVNLKFRDNLLSKKKKDK